MSETEQTHASVADGKILALADRMSPEEISEEIGGWYKPKEVAARIQALLKSRNWLTMAQEDQLVTVKMRELLAKLEERFFDLDNASMQLKVLKEIGTRLDKRQAATDFDIGRLYDNHAKLMFAAMRLGFDQAVVELQKRYPKLKMDELEEVFAASMPEARLMIAERNDGEPLEDV